MHQNTTTNESVESETKIDSGVYDGEWKMD